MGWLSDLPKAHITGVSRYYDQREDPDDADAKQVQLHEVTVKEYRGITYACAYANSTPATYSNGTRSFEIQGNEAGGYTLIETIDMTTGPWVTVEYTAGG